MKTTSKWLTAVEAILIALVLLTGSIAAPILCRPFYYAHIDAMHLPEHTGFTREEIVTAFDEMLDYCLGAEEFSTGVLKWSESGKSHFTDVRGLFLLDVYGFAVTAVLLIALLVWMKYTKHRSARLAGRGPGFWAGAGLGAVFLIIAVLAALDFDRAFTVFHAIFFPGKTNWLFDPATDQIILVLPQDFFRNCAILILVLLVAGCAALILYDVLHGRKQRQAD